MTQGDVLSYLRKKKGWVSLNTLLKDLDINKTSLLRNLGVLFKSGDIIKRDLPLKPKLLGKVQIRKRVYHSKEYKAK